MVNPWPSAAPNVWDVAWSYLMDHVGTFFPGGALDTLFSAIERGCVSTMASATSLVQAYRHEYPEAWLILRQVEAFYKKNASFADPVGTLRNAVAAFHTSESQCRRTNRRVDHYLIAHPDRFEEQFPDLAMQVFTMRKALSHLLGPVSGFTESCAMRIRLTPGATAGRSRLRSLPFLKVCGHICAPKAAHPLISQILSAIRVTPAEGYGTELPLRYIDAFSNRVMFVPKNYKTLRTIAGEPTHAMPVQLAIDGYVKDRLRQLWRIDLRSQLRSQQLARQGSLDGSYSTLDMERASDTVAMSVVQALFPVKWVALLSSLRSSHWSMSLPGRSTEHGVYAKYASMGNGTTFVVETAIFAAACVAVGSRDHMVYGDDICVRARYVPALRRLLKFLGFTENELKSFHTNPGDAHFPFRESCGADWFNGKWVTPMYIRREPTGFGDYHHLLNTMVKIGRPLGQLHKLAAMWVAQGYASHIVPVNSDTRNGVHVDATTAYTLGVIKVARSGADLAEIGPHVPFFWGLRDSGLETRLSTGTRSMLIWHLQKQEVDMSGAGGGGSFTSIDSEEEFNLLSRPQQPFVAAIRDRFADPTVTTRVQENEDVVVSRSSRIVYVPPTSPTKPQLYFWSEAATDILLDFLYEVRSRRR